jgi:hypothetical protein
MKMKVKITRSATFCLVVMFLAPVLLWAQDLSKYRTFSFGMSPAAVLKQTDMKMADVKTIHQQPALIQELTWWLPMLPGSSFQADSVREILFTFYNGELYRMSATYERSAIEGLTAEDLEKSIAAKYGPPLKLPTSIGGSKAEQQGPEEKVVAHWEDAQYSISLTRSYLANGFTLVMYSVKTNVAADEATAKALKREELEGPQKEAERQKKEGEELAAARQKNLQSFQP